MIDDAPRFRPIQIDAVEELSAGIKPSLGHHTRLLAKNGISRVISLPEPDTIAPKQVDRRPNFHGESKLSSEVS
jgi:hypothetical protein